MESNVPRDPDGRNARTAIAPMPGMVIVRSDPDGIKTSHSSTEFNNIVDSDDDDDDKYDDDAEDDDDGEFDEEER